MNQISDNNTSYKSYFDYIVNNQRLIHFESLLITKLDFIKSDYNKKISLFSLSAIFTFLLTVFGFSSDSIGINLIMKISIFKNINVGVIISNFILLLTPIFLLIYTIKLFRIKKSLDLEFLKNPHSQEKLLAKFIIDKHEKQLLVNVNDSFKFLDYYRNNETSIKFFKDDFTNYIYEYLEKNFQGKIDIDVSRYLSEVIILRNLLEVRINKLDNSNNYFEIIISKKNIILFELSNN
ncbi:hypothetical protein ACTFIN_08145 [Clostridium cagae]|uniref:hypothetical protein n=1 Tax=Clostridium cagae TaxID=2080751 RepID=UPI003F75A604